MMSGLSSSFFLSGAPARRQEQEHHKDDEDEDPAENQQQRQHQQQQKEPADERHDHEYEDVFLDNDAERPPRRRLVEQQQEQQQDEEWDDGAGGPPPPSGALLVVLQQEQQQERNTMMSSATPATIVGDWRRQQQQQQDHEVFLNFKNISFVSGGKSSKQHQKKTIVQDVGATIQNGHVLALMGPSGAGKTTVINVLSQHAFYGQAYGLVTLNSIPMNDRIFKRYCYLVKQHDMNWNYLTARESLTFAAQLYPTMAPTVTKGDTTTTTREEEDENKEEVVNRLVQDILNKMGLESCADTLCSRLSGGQQRRLSLATALLKKPKVLFLDEPTSGLDAASATAIMHEITRVAKQERLVIFCTIHQPSTKVYNDFDQVMLLSKGRVAYVGEASTACDYFDSIGYTLPPNTNPAEHFLDIVNADFSSNEEVDRILDQWSLRLKNEESDVRSSPAAAAALEHRHSLVLDEGSLQHNIRHEIKVMMHRHILLMRRDPVMYTGRIALFLIVNCIFGVVYISARNYTQDQALNKLWISGWYIGVPANMAVVAVYKLNLELKSIFVENKNGMSSAISYIIAKTILVIPILFLFSVAALGVPGYLIQRFPPSSFGKLILLFTAQIGMWECSGEAFAALFDEAVLGMLVHTTWWFAALLFSGYLVPLNDMFWPLKAFYYILPYNYYMRSAMYLIFTERAWEACTDSTTNAVCVNSTQGIDVLASFERVIPLVSVEDTYWGDLFVLFALGIFWKIIGVLAIIVKSRRVSSIIDDGGRGDGSYKSTFAKPVSKDTGDEEENIMSGEQQEEQER